MSAREIACRADAESAKSAGPRPLNETTTSDSPDSSGASPVPEMQQLLQMHKELLVLVRTLVQQNERMLEALDLLVHDEHEPGTYLDGTPVDRN